MTDYRLSRLNLLALIGVIILAIWFLLRQLFVFSDYNRAPINLKALIHRPVEAGEIDNQTADATVVCEQKCSFLVGEKLIPARLSNDAAGQLIQLDLNHQRRLEFVGYYPTAGLIGFHSSDGTDWLYSALSPSLIKQ